VPKQWGGQGEQSPQEGRIPGKRYF